MTKRSQQLISCLLALGLTLAGWVAISPELHLAIEHGGQGPAHIHAAGSSLRAFPTSAHPHHHPHDHRDAPPRVPERFARAGQDAPRFVSTHRPFELPTFSVRELLRFLEWLDDRSQNPEDPGSKPTPSGPGHEHHSLPQTLASGCLELSLGLSFARVETIVWSDVGPTSTQPYFPRIFDSQTAGRAPPRFRSRRSSYPS